MEIDSSDEQFSSADSPRVEWLEGASKVKVGSSCNEGKQDLAIVSIEGRQPDGSPEQSSHIVRMTTSTAGCNDGNRLWKSPQQVTEYKSAEWMNNSQMQVRRASKCGKATQK
jgi:hypothetical protein